MITGHLNRGCRFLCISNPATGSKDSRDCEGPGNIMLPLLFHCKLKLDLDNGAFWVFATDGHTQALSMSFSQERFCVFCVLVSRNIYEVHVHITLMAGVVRVFKSGLAPHKVSRPASGFPMLFKKT